MSWYSPVIPAGFSAIWHSYKFEIRLFCFYAFSLLVTNVIVSRTYPRCIRGPRWRRQVVPALGCNPADLRIRAVQEFASKCWRSLRMWLAAYLAQLLPGLPIYCQLTVGRFLTSHALNAPGAGAVARGLPLRYLGCMRRAASPNSQEV